MKPFFTEDDSDHRYGEWISIDKANRLIQERGTKVYESTGMLDTWCAYFDEYRRRSALLINVETIEQDSTEKLVFDFLTYFTDPKMGNGELLALRSRAKALLEKK